MIHFPVTVNEIFFVIKKNKVYRSVFSHHICCRLRGCGVFIAAARTGTKYLSVKRFSNVSRFYNAACWSQYRKYFRKNNEAGIFCFCLGDTSQNLDKILACIMADNQKGNNGFHGFFLFQAEYLAVGEFC